MYNAHKEIYEGPHVSLPEEDEDEGRQGGSAEPQVRPKLPCLRPGASRGGVSAKTSDHLPYVRWRETDLH